MTPQKTGSMVEHCPKKKGVVRGSHQRLTLRMPREINIALRKACRDGNVTMSKYVLRLIINALLRQGHLIIDDRAVLFEQFHL